ncbi:MAG: EAL domain-containing protein [Candidatus Sedimenticola sp. 6PFRAG7]
MGQLLGKIGQSEMPSIPPWLSYGVLYFVCARLSAELPALETAASPLWFASGIALAGMLKHGYRIWWSIFIAVILDALLREIPLPASLGMAASATLEALLACWLMNRFSHTEYILTETRTVMLFILMCVLLAPVSGAALGTLSLWTGGAIDQTSALNTFITWWSGDAAGILLVTPLALNWTLKFTHWPPLKYLEAIALGIATLLVFHYVFGSGLPVKLHNYPLTFMPVPLLVWALFRFGYPVTMSTLIALAVLSMLGTSAGFGAFYLGNINESLVLLQIYIGIMGFTTLIAKSSIEERQQIQDKLSLAGEVIEYTPDAVIITDARGTILAANPAFYKHTGHSKDEIENQPVGILKSGHHDKEYYADILDQLKTLGSWQGEVWNRQKNGEILPEWLSISAVRSADGTVTNYIGVYTDIARQKQIQERIHRLAYYDMLTGLPNRQLFHDRLEQAVNYAGRYSHHMALFFMDLDRFKNINDTLGHATGDKVLGLAAQRLQGCLRNVDTLGRMGGDEFLIILQELKEDFDSVLVAEKILRTFKEPLQLDGHELFLTPSIGVALFPRDGDNPSDLLKHADAAMYRAKSLGGNNFQFFSSEMAEPFKWNLAVENALRQGAEQNAIKLLYQPQFDLQTGAIIGLEALSRWHHPELGSVSPENFIKVAENTGLIHKLGLQTLHNACKQLELWEQSGIEGLTLAVNVSTVQLKQRDFIEHVAQILDSTKTPHNRLELELTETSLMENAEFMEMALEELSNLGLQIAVDDFGTGYSSLSYLKKLPIDRLKIDKSFIDDLPDSSNDAAICCAIIALGHSLNLRVLAEGVETEPQMEFLRKENCDEMQGYLLGKPVTGEEVIEMIRQGFWHTSKMGQSSK